jgi:hypothetical protein
MQTARITRGQADDIMERVLVRHYGFIPAFAANGPRLVRATFPDGQRRLTWYEVVFIEYDSGGLSGKATGVYVDALTGHQRRRLAVAATGCHILESPRPADPPASGGVRYARQDL